MKQVTQMQKEKKRIKGHREEIEKIEDKIEKLQESMKYKMVAKGSEYNGNFGIMTLCPVYEKPTMLNISTDKWNDCYGLTLKRQSVVRLRNYLNDFLKTRPNPK